ncbi:MAG: efflux RND transporter periplasmic adaptor subunit [bacterium]
MKRRLIIITAIVLVVSIAGFGVVKTVTGRQNPKKEDETIKPKRADVSKTVVASGNLQPYVFVEVKSKASGIVEKLYVDTGETVKNGQLLAELDRKQLKARLDRAEASLAAAEANHQRVRRGATPMQLAAAEDAVSRAEVAFSNAEKTFHRVSELFDQGFASKEEFDNAKSARDLAQKDFDAASRQLQTLKQLPLPEDLKEADSNVDQAKAARDDASEEYRNSSIYSPMAGVVLSRLVEVGSAVSSATMSFTGGTAIFVIGDVSQVEFKGFVDEADVGIIKEVMPVEIGVDAYPKEKFVGALKKIEPQGLEKNGVVTFGITVLLDNSQAKLLANMTANANIIVDRHSGVLTVPEEAVKFEKDKAYVYKVTRQNGKVTKKDKTEIQMGFDDGVNVEITGGVTENDEILAKAPVEKKSPFD